MQVLIQIIEINKKLKLIILLNLGEANMLGKKRIYIWIIYLHNILFF
jgi:hypothetical protein